MIKIIFGLKIVVVSCLLGLYYIRLHQFATTSQLHYAFTATFCLILVGAAIAVAGFARMWRRYLKGVSIW